MIYLITGGSGCGKSHFAERLVEALRPKRRVYIATMPVTDDECRRRVERHRALRAGKGYETVEARTLWGLNMPEGATALLECLPTLLADEMFLGGDPERIVPGLKALAKAAENLVMVTNDVFSDGLAYDPATLAYMERLARVNRAAARMADSAAEVVYSIPVPLKGEFPL